MAAQQCQPVSDWLEVQARGRAGPGQGPLKTSSSWPDSLAMRACQSESEDAMMLGGTVLGHWQHTQADKNLARDSDTDSETIEPGTFPVLPVVL